MLHGNTTVRHFKSPIALVPTITMLKPADTGAPKDTGCDGGYGRQD
jgi:hypothetical protein